MYINKKMIIYLFKFRCVKSLIKINGLSFLFELDLKALHDDAITVWVSLDYILNRLMFDFFNFYWFFWPPLANFFSCEESEGGNCHQIERRKKT